MSREPEAPGAGVASLMSDVIAGVGRLVQGELMLARAEAAEGLRAATSGLVKLVAAAIVGLVGLNVLSGAAVAALAATGIGPVWAALVVGLTFCGIALVLGLSGRSAMRLRRLWPGRAVSGLRKDGAAVHAGLHSKGVQNV